MTNVDSQRIREIRDNTKAMAEAFSSIANTLADALELYISTRTETKTETQNSNLTFEKDECAKEYEELGLKELKELIEADRKTEPSNSEKLNNSTISKMEQVEDEPLKTTDYCDICKRDMCEVCIADATNPYCVPSHYEINYEPKDEPQEEVIRCKDCKHSDTVTYPSGITEMTCPIMFETDCDDPFCVSWLIVDPNDFCSYGEVRDE